MRNVVVDASVAIKWLIPSLPDESDIPQAVALFDQMADGKIELFQPPHFLPEVIAVVCRLKPEYAPRILAEVLNLDFTRIENSAVYSLACDLSIRLNHHLFDTLYHAVALTTPDAMLITADENYYRKAQAIGHIIRL